MKVPVWKIHPETHPRVFGVRVVSCCDEGVEAGEW